MYPYLLSIIEAHLNNKDIKDEDKMSREFMMGEVERFKDKTIQGERNGKHM